MQENASQDTSTRKASAIAGYGKDAKDEHEEALKSSRIVAQEEERNQVTPQGIHNARAPVAEPRKSIRSAKAVCKKHCCDKSDPNHRDIYIRGDARIQRAANVPNAVANLEGKCPKAMIEVRNEGLGKSTSKTSTITWQRKNRVSMALIP